MSRWVWRFLLSCFVCGVTHTVSFLVVLPPTRITGRSNLPPATIGGLDHQSTWIPRYAQTVPHGQVTNDNDPRHVILKLGRGPSQERSNKNPSSRQQQQHYQIVPISQFFQLGYTLQDITSLTCDTAAILLSQRVPRPSAPLPVTWILSTGSAASTTTTAAGNNSTVHTTSAPSSSLDESGLLVAINKSQAERLVADLTQSTASTVSTSNPTTALDGTSTSSKTARDTASTQTLSGTPWPDTPTDTSASTRAESNNQNKDTLSTTTSRTPFLQVSPQEFVPFSTIPLRRTATSTTTQTLERESLNIVSTIANSNQSEVLQEDVSVLLYTDWQGNLSFVPTANLTRLGYSVEELRRLHTTAFDRIVLGKIVRPHQGIPVRWNSLVGEEGTVVWVPTMQAAQVKLERYKRMQQLKKIRIQTEQSTKNDRGDPPPPKSSWLVDMRTYRKQLRESAAFRLKWLGKSWAPWIQQEANLRLDLYKNFLWMWHDYVEGDHGYRAEQ